jgi:hypothetical protein
MFVFSQWSVFQTAESHSPPPFKVYSQVAVSIPLNKSSANPPKIVPTPLINAPKIKNPSKVVA